MNTDYKSKEFKSWLDKLQQQSWELELIISGFTIYGLISAYEPLEIAYITAAETGREIQALLGVVLLSFITVLTFNLVIHVIFRGLWIGAIGLRYVSGDIDFKGLNYSKKFTEHLEKKVGSFDKFIAGLENICSILFALSFLLIFYLLAYISVQLFIFGPVYVVGEILPLPETATKIIIYTYVSLMLIGALFVLIDFIGQGILKKKKWTSRIYFPIYRAFAFITLSFLYRPLTYNFLDHKFTKRLSLIIVPIYMGILLLSSLAYQDSNYLSSEKPSSETFSSIKNYESLMTEPTVFTQIASIPSKVIERSYLKVFILYNEDMEDYIFESNSLLKPEKDERGFTSEIVQGMNAAKHRHSSSKETLSTEYLKTFSTLYTVAVDSIDYPTDFVITTNKKERLGFETYLNIRGLKEGKHLLRISGPMKKKSKRVDTTLVTIPFWYYLDD